MTHENEQIKTKKLKLMKKAKSKNIELPKWKTK